MSLSLSLILFIAPAVILIALLAWAARPPKKLLVSPNEALEALSRERHYARLPQILQSLREEDTEFLRARGYGALLVRLRQERKRIALHYLDFLEEEFQILLACSRILSSLAPELGLRGEFARFRSNLRFIWCCRYVRLRLRLGLQPWDAFGTISDMAGTLTLQLEAATARLAEKALHAANST